MSHCQRRDGVQNGEARAVPIRQISWPRPPPHPATRGAAAVFSERLAEADGEIEAELAATASDERLIVLEAEGVMRIWDEVAAQFPRRVLLRPEGAAAGPSLAAAGLSSPQESLVVELPHD